MLQGDAIVYIIRCDVICYRVVVRGFKTDAVAVVPYVTIRNGTTIRAIEVNPSIVTRTFRCKPVNIYAFSSYRKNMT